MKMVPAVYKSETKPKIKYMKSPNIMILGVGCSLLTDEGFGIHVINELERRYSFEENISVVDGGVLGINLLGVICDVDELIVVDVIRNDGEPGTLYRLDHDDIPDRVRAKNSLHQIDFLEAMTLCRHGLGKAPHTVILGVEPLDITTYTVELTPVIQNRMEEMIELVLKEVKNLGGDYQAKGVENHVSSHSL